MSEQNVDTAVSVPETPAEVAVEKLSDADMLEIERANNKRQLSVANAKNATLEAEAAEMSYKNLVMTLFLKHGLTQEDAINQDGTIVRRGAAKAAQ